MAHWGIALRYLLLQLNCFPVQISFRIELKIGEPCKEIRSNSVSFTETFSSALQSIEDMNASFINVRIETQISVLVSGKVYSFGITLRWYVREKLPVLHANGKKQEVDVRPESGSGKNKSEIIIQLSCIIWSTCR